MDKNNICTYTYIYLLYLILVPEEVRLYSRVTHNGSGGYVYEYTYVHVYTGVSSNQGPAPVDFTTKTVGVALNWATCAWKRLPGMLQQLVVEKIGRGVHLFFLRFV